jgi:hypothetical protein
MVVAIIVNTTNFIKGLTLFNVLRLVLGIKY